MEAEKEEEAEKVEEAEKEEEEEAESGNLFLNKRRRSRFLSSE